MKKINLLSEFKAFILKQGVIGLAIGVVMGAAAGKLVKALVDDLIMPLVGFVTPDGNWKAFTIGFGRVQFGVGDFIGNVVDFAIVSFAVFILIKALIREKPVMLATTKQCPECLEPHLPSMVACEFNSKKGGMRI